MARSEHGTRADTTYESIRSDILSGRLEPGTRLKFTDLATAHGVGVGVIREALTRLAQQALVRTEPHLGFQVTPISAEDLMDLTDARADLEGLVFRKAIEHGDLAWEADIVASLHTLERTDEYDEADRSRVSDAWSAAHLAFHLRLLAACPNLRLLQIASSLRDSALVYQAWSQQTRRRSHRNARAEHRQLMELALARDADAAVDALQRHIRLTTTILLEESPNEQESQASTAQR
jgi:DNA-binding GntR family transcriptional regulator